MERPEIQKLPQVPRILDPAALRAEHRVPELPLRATTAERVHGDGHRERRRPAGGPGRPAEDHPAPGSAADERDGREVGHVTWYASAPPIPYDPRVILAAHDESDHPAGPPAGNKKPRPASRDRRLVTSLFPRQPPLGRRGGEARGRAASSHGRMTTAILYGESDWSRLRQLMSSGASLLNSQRCHLSNPSSRREALSAGYRCLAVSMHADRLSKDARSQFCPR